MTEWAQPLCPRCLEPLPAGVDFCPKCQVSLTVKATTDPYQGLLSERFAYREAAENPQKAIVVIGMWLLWGPRLLIGTALEMGFVVASVGALFEILIEDELTIAAVLETVVVFALAAVCLGFGLLVSGKLLYKTTRNYFRRENRSG